MSEFGTICFLLGIIIGLLVAILRRSAILTERTAFKHDLMDAPTVDAVQVVRCKDCKWRGDIGCAITIVDESDGPMDEDFCSWGERRENGDN